MIKYVYVIKYRLALPVVLAMLLMVLFISGCLNRSANSANSNKTDYTRFNGYRGALNIVADEGLQSIMKQQIEMFAYNYDSVQTTINYKSEKDMFSAFRKGQTTVMVLLRKLTPEEIKAFTVNDTIAARQQPVAYDAVALIGSKNYDDSKLDMDALKKYFRSGANSQDIPHLVFESKQSSAVKFVLDTLGYKQSTTSNIYAFNSAAEVISYVAVNKNAIGFIPYNLISDEDDPRVKKLMDSIKILSLNVNRPDRGKVRVSANQSDIATGEYPLTRVINTVTRYTYKDNLELLFISFMAHEKGARIFLKAGLMPEKMPEREVIVN